VLDLQPSSFSASLPDLDAQKIYSAPCFCCCGLLLKLLSCILAAPGRSDNNEMLTLSPDTGQVSQVEPGVSPAKDVGMIVYHNSFSSEGNNGAKILNY
jgi:hypothetical protein